MSHKHTIKSMSHKHTIKTMRASDCLLAISNQFKSEILESIIIDSESYNAFYSGPPRLDVWLKHDHSKIKRGTMLFTITEYQDGLIRLIVYCYLLGNSIFSEVFNSYVQVFEMARYDDVLLELERVGYGAYIQDD